MIGEFSDAHLTDHGCKLCFKIGTIFDKRQAFRWR